MTRDPIDGVTTYLAGAGTGKTYQICEEIRDAVLDGMNPERIIATTFTKKAAAELKDRVKEHIYEASELSSSEKIDRAQDLERAAIGTVHSLGNHFLKRYAIELGLSPRLTVLDEDESRRKLNEFLGVVNKERWEEIFDQSRPFEIDSIQDILRQLIREKRLNGIAHDAFRTSMKRSVDRLCEILAPEGTDETLASPEEFQTMAERVQQKLEDSEYDYKYIRKAIRKLEDAGGEQRVTWKTIATFAGFLSEKDKVSDLARPVRAFAESIRAHPKLHEDLRSFITVLTEEVIRIENEYQEFKEERGLLDYIDLEAKFLNALRSDAIANDIRQSFDVLFVDEFQDSNPIQLAIFLRLHELIGRSYWVGDEKQSIYGFRDADLQLVQNAVDLIDESDQTSLNTSYRTHKSLVSIFNDLFTPVFGPEAQLKASDSSTPDQAVERWCLNVSNRDEEGYAIAEGVQQLLDESHDPEEIAVLTRTNARAINIGESLEELGIPSVVEQPGLLDRRECAIALAGMKVVADPQDTLARATIHHLFEDPDRDLPEWIRTRLQQISEDRKQNRSYREIKAWNDDPYYERLSDIDVELLSPSSIAESVIQHLNIPERMSSWGRPDRRAANLDAFVEFVRSYEDEMSEKGRGITIRGFIEWAEDQREEQRDLIPVLDGVKAVTVMTYHRAKGLEWPVVVLSQLNTVHDADMWRPRVSGGRVEDGTPLEDRSISFWPWPFGTKGYGPFQNKVSGTGLQEDALNTEEGAEARAKNEGERKRLYYVGMTRASERLVFAHRGHPDDLPAPNRYAALDAFPVDEVLQTHRGEEDTIDLPEHQTSVHIRHITPSDVRTRTNPPDQVVDLEVDRRDDPSYNVRYTSPSEDTEEPGEWTLTPEELPEPHPFEDPVDSRNWEALGNAVHAFLAGFTSCSELDRNRIVSIAERCLKTHEVPGVLAPSSLVEAARRFHTWLQNRYPDSDWATEVPVSASIRNSQAVGAIDVLIQDEQGRYIIVDHKIKPVPKSMWVETASQYTAQLSAYRTILEQQDRPVRACWIHLPLAGGMVRVEPEEETPATDAGE